MSSRVAPILCLTLAMLLWASAFIALKLAFRHYDPMVVLAGRMLVASCCFIWVLRRFGPVDYRAGDWKLIGLLMLAEPCLYFLFEASALQYTSAAQAGMITALLPLLVAVGAWFFLRERLRLQAWLGFALAVAGALWLSFTAPVSQIAPNPLLGNFLEFCAMLCAMLYTLCLKRLSSRYSPWLLTALQSFCGTLFFVPLLAVPTVELPAVWVWQAVLAILYLGLVVNIFAYGLFNLGVSLIPASQASAYINLIPVFTVILAYVLLRETLSLQQLGAAALIVGGVVLSQWPGPRPATQMVVG
ncbi:DMT family transporter [Marinobacterium rhizophilum]|uniref:DMT family transporter n=1 Tax=Marinobacterium rhizophilum TaxID=420402 RepID=A0ABY5HDV2_9GAMM|nr:DMT family transporter [Marinobacterium rhizophilum]UTW10388.1 DMT family transporter [Marinobacterium rhizophilum]